MTKHACGSCNFFQEARESKQGWCTHPDRRETTAVRILVRSAELRCRNDWGADLWQERADRDQVLDIVMNDASSKAQPDSSARPIPAPLVETPPIVFPATEVVETIRVGDTEQAKLVSDNLNRELLRRAHHQARERVRNRGYSAEMTAPRDSNPPVEREALVISNQYVPPSRQIDPSADASGLFEFNNKAGTGKFDERVVSSVPSDFPSDTRFPKTSPVDERAFQARDTTYLVQSGSKGKSDSESDFDWGAPTERATGAEIESPLVPVPASSAEEEIDCLPARANRNYRDSGPSRRTDRHEIAPSEMTSAQVHDRFDNYGISDRAAIEASRVADYEVAQIDDSASWPVDTSARIPEGVWSGIVKTCQTCRDFRPAGNGQRGWCTNQWAFKHRRMVDAQDRPCETSIGHWWIPGDVAWQGSLDIAALGQPTPNVDKYLGRDETLDSIPFRRRRQS